MFTIGFNKPDILKRFRNLLPHHVLVKQSGAQCVEYLDRDWTINLGGSARSE